MNQSANYWAHEKSLEWYIENLAKSIPVRWSDINVDWLAQKHNLSVIESRWNQTAWKSAERVKNEGPHHYRAKEAWAEHLPVRGRHVIESNKFRSGAYEVTVEDPEPRETDPIKIIDKEPDIVVSTNQVTYHGGIIVEITADSWLPLGDYHRTVAWLHNFAEKIETYLRAGYAIYWIFSPTAPALQIKEAAEEVIELITHCPNVELGYVDLDTGCVYPGHLIRREHHIKSQLVDPEEGKWIKEANWIDEERHHFVKFPDSR